MASFTPVRGTRNEINAVSMVDGQFLYETDQGDGNRIYADIIDSNGDPKRVQVGGERGDQNRLVYLKDVALTNPQNNDYLKYDSVNQKWVNDGTLNNKIKNLDNNGQIDGTNVKYDNTTDMTTKVNSKISMPTGGTTGDSLVLGIGNVPEWKQIRINVVDNLSSTSATDALSANQGRNLNSSISNLTTVVNQKVDAPKNAGTSGQVLALDAVGNTIWKTVSGGGGTGGGDWSDITNKPFDVVYDQSISANNADFDIQLQSISSGTSVNVLYLNDDKIYRPTDTDDITPNTDPAYLPVSVNKTGGGQEKKRISFSNFVDRIKNKIFKLSAVANGDFLRYDSTSQKWVNDSTVANKLYDIDNTTIIKNSVSNELEVPIDNNTIIVDSSDNKVKVSNNITTKLSKVDTTDNLSVELAKKIDKPASATNGQVLTYNGTSNEWEAQDSQGGSNEIVYLNSDVWDSTRDYVQDDYAIDEQNLYKALGNNANSKPSQNPLLWKKVSIVEELNNELIDYSNEIVVGKLNGKPLYQKIIVQDINISKGTTLFEIGSVTMSYIVILGATFKWNTDYFSIPRVHTDSTYNIGLEIIQDNGKIKLRILTGYQYGNVRINVHLEYTKTTD